MKDKQIPVVSYDEFRGLAKQNPNLLHENPWVVAGYIEHWPGYRQWQTLEYLQSRFGHLSAFARAPNFITNRKTTLLSVQTRYAQYLEYIRSPQRVEEIYRGCWVDGTYDDFIAQPLPLYCGNLKIVQQAGDKVFDELSPLVPKPLECWNHALPYYYSLFNHVWLLVSLPGALSPLHTDNNATIALIAQLKGKKKATLYCPDDRRYVYNPRVGFMNPREPDETDYPNWRSAVPWTCVLDVGEVLFVGTNWAHQVETLETSISVSYDFVNASNIAAYAAAPQWAEGFGERLKADPDLVAKRMQGAITADSIRESPSLDLGRRVMLHILQSSMADARASEETSIRRSYLTHLEACMA